MNDFYIIGWIWTLAIGLPIFCAVAKFRWGAAQRSGRWRVLICALLACAITPSFVAWTNGHNDGGVIFVPAVLMLACIFAGESRGILMVVVLGLLPICIVSSVLFGIWSAVIKRRTRP